MDRDKKGAATASGRDRRLDGRRQSSDDGTAPPRQSPTSLAPLELLQNQRKGSITDPSLHASPKSQLRTSLPHSRTSSSGPRSRSPYIFGDPSTQSKHPLAGNGGVSHSRKNSVQDGSDMNKHRHSKEDDRMEIEREPSSKPATSTSHAAKRKVPSNREEPTTQHIDPQLVGSRISADVGEGPAPKRRGSGVDTQKIAQLSLNDRRNSPDQTAGVPSPHIQWWSKQTRREAASSTNNGSTASAGVTGGAAQGIATFTWPHSNVASQVNMLPDPNQHIQGPPPFDPSVQMQMMSPVNFAQDRRLSAQENPGIPSSSGPTRALRSRSRARDIDQASTQLMSHDDASSSGTKDDGPGGSRQTPYSRSPELRVSHKLAERKRRKEMKDLFDELRDQLPQDRGMKASKWEILSKAIDFIVTMKQTHGEMSREIEMLRHEVDGFRQGMPPPFHHGGPPPQVMFGVPPPYPPPGGPVPPHHGPHPGGPPTTAQQPPPGNEPSRPGSSQNSFPSGSGPNGDAESRTGTPSS